MKKISLCIPTYERYEVLFESFSKVLNDERIDEIIINDDCSSDVSKILSKIKEIDNKKIKFYRNERNLGVLHNKAKTTSLASNDWVILLDSDNFIDIDYLDRIESLDLNDNIIYCPQILKFNNKTLFDFEAFSKKNINISYLKKNVNNTQLHILLNTGNYFFNKKNYLKSYKLIDKSVGRNSDACDVFYFSYYFLIGINNSSFKVVNGLEYFHRIHEGSFYVNNAKKNGEIVKDLINKINEYK